MLFLTVEKSFSAETEEKKSRFIAHLVPLPGFDAALEVLRRDHPRAAHHVTAFRAISDDGRIIESAKDDG